MADTRRVGQLQPPGDNGQRRCDILGQPVAGCQTVDEMGRDGRGKMGRGGNADGRVDDGGEHDFDAGIARALRQSQRWRHAAAACRLDDEAPYGARVAHSWDVARLKRVFAVLMTALGGYMAWRAARG